MGRARVSAGPAAGKKALCSRRKAGVALWSMWPDPEQIKGDSEVAAGPALVPAGRELHKRMGLGMVWGLSWAKHVLAATRSRSRCCRRGRRCLWGRRDSWAAAETRREVGLAGLGEEHPCSSSLCFIFLISPPPEPVVPGETPLRGAAVTGAMRTASP